MSSSTSQSLPLAVHLPSGRRDRYWVQASDPPRVLFDLIEAKQGLPSDMICLVIMNPLRLHRIDAVDTHTLGQCMGTDLELLVVLKYGGG